MTSNPDNLGPAPGNQPPSDPWFDPRFDALLDEALSPTSVPGGIPAGLNQRILAATTPLLAQQSTDKPALKLVASDTQPHDAQGLITRLDLIWWVRSLAASIVVAAVLGIVLTVASIFRGAQGTVALNELDYDLAQAMASASHTPTARGSFWSPGTGSNPVADSIADPVRISNDANAALRSIDAALKAMEDEAPVVPDPNDSSSRIF